VLERARAWADETGRGNHNIMSIRCTGSIADGRWGVGSDLDIVMEVQSSAIPFDARGRDFSPPECGVPVDLSVYTTEELVMFRKEGRRFTRELDCSSIVLYHVS
jgi:hypothetical protein